ncbi:MAG: PilZ domain-containing protein [Pseudomonadota bacterium]
MDRSQHIQGPERSSSRPGAGSRRATDRRADERRYLQRPVRFLAEDGREYAGDLRDISTGGMRIRSDFLPHLESTIILYIDFIGRFEGRCIRQQGDEFAVEISLSVAKLARLQQAIEEYFLAEVASARIVGRRTGRVDRRAHHRNDGSEDELYGEKICGERFRFSVSNMSLSGIEIVTDANLSIGDQIRVGATKGVVVRCTAGGYGIQRCEPSTEKK